MLTGVHGVFIAGVKGAIYTQLTLIRDGAPSPFHRDLLPAPPSTKPKHEPDASFWHDDAQYFGL